MLAAAAVLLAWGIDAVFGEPRDAAHPVAWFGRILARPGRVLPTLRPVVAFIAGAVLWVLAIAAVVAIAWFMQDAIGALPAWAALPLLALALKPAFAWRMLKDEVRAVDDALAQGLDAGRARLSRLCSRDVSLLDAAGVRETAIETLGENFNDSLVAPLFWFAVAGLPGAWGWRAANTLDAMWGYRGRWEWAGKWAARADDVLAWLPARLAAGLLWRPGLRGLREEARRTPSPNGGWPMAALALRLGVRLGKPGTYVLNPGAPAPGAADVSRALQLMQRAAHAAFGLAALVLGLRAGWSA